MPKTLQFRRGTTSELSSISGSVGELFVDTTKDTVVVMDGSTAGGFELTQNSATQTLSNKTFSDDILPSVTDVYDLGSSTYKWNDGYFANSVVIDEVTLTGQYGTLRIPGATSVSGDIIPLEGGVYDLGTSSSSFYTGYFSNDINIGPISIANVSGTLTTSSDVSVGSLLVDDLLLSENTITSSSDAIEYGGSKGIVEINNSNLDARDGDWLGIPVVETVGESSPATTGLEGMFRYNKDEGRFEGYTTEWSEISTGSGGGATTIGALSDVSSLITPSTGQVLKWTGSHYEPGTAGAADVPTADGTFTGEIVFMPNNPSPGDFISTNQRTVTYSAANNRITWTDDLVGFGGIVATNLYRQRDLNDIGSGTWRGQGMRPTFWEKDGDAYTGRYFEVSEAVDDPYNIPGTNSNGSYIYKPSAGTGFTGFYGQWKRLSATPDFKIDDVFLTSMGKNPSAVVVGVENPDATVDNDVQELPPNDIYDLQQIAGNTKTPKFRVTIQPAAGEFNHALSNGRISIIDFTRKTDHVGNFIYTVTDFEFDTTNSRYIIDFTVSNKFELPAVARMSDLVDVQHSNYEGGTIEFNAINPSATTNSTQTDFDGLAIDNVYYIYTLEEIIDLLPATGSFTVGTAGGDVTLSYTSVSKVSSTTIRFQHQSISSAITDNYRASIIGTKVTTPTDGQVLAYETKRQVWYPKTIVDGFDYATSAVTTSAAVDAVAGTVNLIDCSSNAVTVTLPSSPSRGDICHIIDASGDSGTYNITIDRNGNNINSAASNLTINTSHGNAKLIYTGITSAGWVKLYN